MANSIDKIQNSALAGIQKGLSGVAENAEKIAKVDPEADLAGAIVDLKQDERQVKASAKLVKVAKSLDDEILNILA